MLNAISLSLYLRPPAPLPGRPPPVAEVGPAGRGRGRAVPPQCSSAAGGDACASGRRVILDGGLGTKTEDGGERWPASRCEEISGKTWESVNFWFPLGWPTPTAAHPPFWRPHPGVCREDTMSNPFLKQVFNKDKTFRPKRKFEPGTQRFELHKKAQASLNAGLDLKLAVQLPPGEELNDWVAVHVVDFFNRVNLIYGTISDGCTEQSCPIMSGGPKYEYRWQDEHKFRKPTALSAPQYMDLLMDWIEVQINNEDVFPTNVGTPFPKNFLQVVKKILSRLFRVFVHVYIHHFDRIAQMGSEAHVNTCYKHFYYFVKEFGLIDTKELEPLKEMTARMCH
ncbi:MOB kinase activator 3A isoform X1 [Saccopteryx bilineata]|uniref:MOB kinase activator 3A isoform X1 n=2 Tax=Saccopteryx bilineata TaxID=59482 RepID=UPI0033903FC3